MHQETALIGTLAAGFSAAFILGMIANRLRIPPIVGHLTAGMAIGPFTPGFVADQGLAPQLAEIGVILLMFGVGLHFSPSDLIAFSRSAIPGALALLILGTGLGLAAALVWGWTFGEGLVLGLTLSVASTVVVLRALETEELTTTRIGKLAIAWLIVQDLAMVLVLVLLPLLADPLGGVPHNATDGRVLIPLLEALAKVAVFSLVMLVGGIRFIPWLLTRVLRTESQELFMLAVLTTALGVAFGAAELFDVSFALGAFLAGLVLAESEIGHDAAEQLAPLQGPFTVLFFVSVGMLIDPSALIHEPFKVIVIAIIIVLVKSVVAYVLAIALGGSIDDGLTIGASQAQIGEFSFIVASLGTSLALLPEVGNDLVLGGALISITVNPILFGLMPKVRELLVTRRIPLPIPQPNQQ